MQKDTLTRRLRIPRFSLRTLLLFALLIGSGMALGWHWEPWRAERKITLAHLPTVEIPPTRAGFIAPGSQKYGSVEAGFSPDGKKIFTLWAQDEWSWGTGVRFRRGEPPPKLEPPLIAPAISPTVRVFDVETGHEEWCYVDEDIIDIGECASIVLSPGGKWLILGMPTPLNNADRPAEWQFFNIRILNLQTGKQLALPAALKTAAEAEMQRQPNSLSDWFSDFNPLNKGAVTNSVLFSPDDSMVAIEWLGKTYIFPAANVGNCCVLNTQDGVPLAFSNRQECLAMGSGDLIEIWDLAEKRIIETSRGNAIYDRHLSDPSTWYMRGRLIKELNEKQSKYTLVYESPPAPALRCETNGKNIRVTKSDGDAITIFSGSKLMLKSANAAPDGTRIVSVSLDGTAHIWQLCRPEYWWGIAWLPEFWATAVFASALCWSVLKDRVAFDVIAHGRQHESGC